ncbi:MAG: flagellar basal body-associated FliL family protein [Lachnospiraceae bacterium]|nr:flagellar basal body-associated FliL family protein [Lachnospiraceae bacterium]
MKKNIFTIIIMALAVINVILTAVIVFTTVPAMNRTNNLVKQISQMVDLELESSEKNDDAVVSVKDKENHTFKNASEGTITINLQNSADGGKHYAQLDAVYVTVNKSADGYKDLVSILDKKGSDVIEIVTNVIASYDYERITTEKSQLKTDIVSKLQEFFESDAIIDVSFDNLCFQ